MIVRPGRSLAPCDVVLELDFTVDIGGELNDERFQRFEGVFQVLEGRESR